MGLKHLRILVSSVVLEPTPRILRTTVLPLHLGFQFSDWSSHCEVWSTEKSSQRPPRMPCPFPFIFQSTWSKVCILDPQSAGVAVHSPSHVQLFATPWTSACQASPSFTISRSFLKLLSIESMMPSNHLILCHPLPLLPSIFPSIRVFSNGSTLHIKWPKYWSFSFSISSSSEYSRLISFRIDYFDLLAVQGALKSLLQHHNLKVSILRC